LKKFILSDLHIGHKDAQYDAMDQAISYIQREAKPGDEIWGLGDWFHMYENGFEHCLQHPMTQNSATSPGKSLPNCCRAIMTMYWKNTGIIPIWVIL